MWVFMIRDDYDNNMSPYSKDHTMEQMQGAHAPCVCKFILMQSYSCNIYCL
jgi:hypothetical protein